MASDREDQPAACCSEHHSQAAGSSGSRKRDAPGPSLSPEKHDPTGTSALLCAAGNKLLLPCCAMPLPCGLKCYAVLCMHPMVLLSLLWRCAKPAFYGLQIVCCAMLCCAMLCCVITFCRASKSCVIVLAQDCIPTVTAAGGCSTSGRGCSVQSPPRKVPCWKGRPPHPVTAADHSHSSSSTVPALPSQAAHQVTPFSTVPSVTCCACCAVADASHNMAWCHLGVQFPYSPHPTPTPTHPPNPLPRFTHLTLLHPPDLPSPT